MESNSTSNLFELHVDHDGSSHLKEAARWGKFLGIIGIIFCCLIVLLAIFAGSIIGALFSRSAYGYGSGVGAAAGAGVGAFITVMYILIALLYFFPSLYLYRFGGKAQMALRSNDQEQLNQSFKNLKACFRFMGILTIICLGLIALGIVINVIAVASLSR